MVMHKSTRILIQTVVVAAAVVASVWFVCNMLTNRADADSRRDVEIVRTCESSDDPLMCMAVTNG